MSAPDSSHHTSIHPHRQCSTGCSFTHTKVVDRDELEVVRQPVLTTLARGRGGARNVSVSFQQ